MEDNLKLDVRLLMDILKYVIPAGYKEHQDVALALSMCEHYLNGRGAYRVHGGGFAGTVAAVKAYIEKHNSAE